jgi:membrane protease YdiL (CAAX protease family)
MDSERPPWPASSAVAGFFFSMLVTILLVTMIGAFYLAAGFDDPNDAESFEFVAIAAQSLAFVGVTLAVTSRISRPRPSQFGFRRTDASAAFGWTVAAFLAYFTVAAVYTAIVHPPADDLPQRLGADKSTALTIITAVFVVGVAPPVEEFFFRGFIYQAFRNRMGVPGAAVTSGLIFGAIHLKPEFLVPLAALGMMLALLFQKTNSIWPCIALHAFNNALALLVLI